MQKITRLAVLMTAVLSALTLFSCQKNEPAEASNAGISRFTEFEVESEAVDITFNATYSRTDGYIPKKTYPYVTVINTRADLEKYTAEHEGQYNFYETTSSAGFYDIVTSYDTEFFTNYSLIMIMLEESSGSITHEVESITCEDGASVITIKRYIKEVMTDDLAEWHVIVELPKDSPVLENPDKTSVVLNDTKK